MMVESMANNEALLRAIRSASVAELQQLVDAHAWDVKKRIGDESALSVAAACNRVDVIEWLIDVHCVDVNEVDAGGNTALNLACKKSMARPVEALLRRGADVSKVNHFGRGPLHHCAMRGDMVLLRALTAAHNSARSVNAISGDGHTALSFACFRGHFDVVRHLVEHCGAAVEQPGRSDWSVILATSGARSPAMVRYLLQHGVDVNGSAAETAAVEAARLGLVTILDELLFAGVPAAVSNLLFVATRGGHADTIARLFEEPSTIDCKPARRVSLLAATAPPVAPTVRLVMQAEETVFAGCLVL